MDDTEDTASAMAAAMGFSSFGTQNPNKRRKFNPSTDAVVASDASTSTSTLPFHQGITTTGSNMVPLGTRRQNKDEIDLDDDEEEGEQRIPPENQEVPRIAANGNVDSDDFEPQYLGTSRPLAPIAADRINDLQSKIDAIVGDSADGSLAPPPSTSSASGGGSLCRGGRGGGRQHNTNRDSRTEHRWWDDYYDPAFLVNPWEKIEKAQGLEPRDYWMSWEEAKAARS